MSKNFFKKNLTKIFCINKKLFMSLLITGSSGFIGTNLILFFKKKKIKFFCIDKVKNRYIKDKNFFQLNLKNKSKLEKIFKKKK